MKIQLTLTCLAFLFLFSCQNEEQIAPPTNPFYNWENVPNRTWVGEAFWANRLQDWQIQDGRLECKIPHPMRTAHLLKHRLGEQKEAFEISFETGMIASSDSVSVNASTGILLGAGKDLDYRAASLIHHSYGIKGGIYIGIDVRGNLFVKEFEQEKTYFERIRLTSVTNLYNIKILVEGTPDEQFKFFKMKVTVFEANGARLGSIRVKRMPAPRLIGNIALVSDSESGVHGGRFWFNKLKLIGSKIETFEDRNCGPVISCQHTLSNKTLNLTAQFLPLGQEDNQTAIFQIKNNGQWEDKASGKLMTPSFTIPFKIENWNDKEDIPYRIKYEQQFKNDSSKVSYHEGVIRSNPINKDQITVAAFTGNHNNARPNPNKWGGVDIGTFPWNWGLWFPHTDIIENVKKHQPDVLFFSGDQVYEGASPTWADRKNGQLDYLYKWYLWCWAFGELTTDIPAITIPDDHDVYHGNIWGAGGIATPPGLQGAAAQDMGGYKMPPAFVNMVERTQTSHFPAPYDPTPIAQDIGVYYTDMNYGGISFAILEDRKFKSAPKTLLPNGQIRNGWSANPDWDAKTQSDHPAAKLLGNRQLVFLEDWVNDWTGGTEMKAVLSQTIFANVATLPEEAKNDGVVPKLPILKEGEYAPNDRPVADMDSNGWPASGRNKALRAIRKGFAVHIAGDQHLGSTIQYGVDDFGDAGFALCVPSIGNFFPRRWFPIDCGENRKENAPCYTGDFEDGFGNKISVHAISNPAQTNRKPKELHQKANGYGVVKFNKRTREIVMENWPRWANPEKDAPYFGWPVQVKQAQNYGKKTYGYIANLQVKGMDKPVIQVINMDNDEIYYSIRLSSPSSNIKVFEKGTYKLRVGDPDLDNWEIIEGLEAKIKVEDAKRVSVNF